MTVDNYREPEDQVLFHAASWEAIPADAQQDGDLVPLLEALLLASEGPARISELTVVTGRSRQEIETILDGMRVSEDRGWVVVRHGSQVQIATAPRFAEQVRTFLGLEREARLSPAALETLAIVAYEQPVTRSAIEAIRGVDCTAVLTTLLTRGVIQASGRVDTAGQPFEYTTTPDFLRYFGLRSLDDLPPLGVLEGIDLGETLSQAIGEVAEREKLELVGTTIVNSPLDARELTDS